MRVSLVCISAKEIQVFLSRFYWMHGKPKIPVSNSLINKMDILKKKKEYFPEQHNPKAHT